MLYYIPLHISSRSQRGKAVRYFFRRQSYPRLPASGALQIAGLGGFGRRLGPSELEQLRYSRRLQWSAGAIKLVFSVMAELRYIQTCSDFVEQRSNAPFQGPLPLNPVSHAICGCDRSMQLSLVARLFS